jgi:hypothetical protein
VCFVCTGAGRLKLEAKIRAEYAHTKKSMAVGSRFVVVGSQQGKFETTPIYSTPCLKQGELVGLFLLSHGVPMAMLIKVVGPLPHGPRLSYGHEVTLRWS